MGKKKNLKKKIVKAGKIGVAAARLGGRLSNPVNQAKFIGKAATGGGFILPGSKYIGPGNSMNLGKPKNKTDAAAFQHDKDYDSLLKSGVKPAKLYMGYSDADSRLLKKSDPTTPEGLATYVGMSAKKGLYKMGLTGKKIRDKDVKKKYVKKRIHNKKK